MFDTIPVLAVIAGTIAIVGRENERLKWRIVGSVMLVASLVIGMIFGFSIYTDPIAGLIAR